jgi:hypothetical protein
MKIIIATTKVPLTIEKFTSFCASLRDAAHDRKLTINKGIIFTEGPGCANLAMELIGNNEDIEKFANGLTMALMPSKWGTTQDAMPEIDTCELSWNK